jgi:hypothetical protein
MSLGTLAYREGKGSLSTIINESASPVDFSSESAFLPNKVCQHVAVTNCSAGINLVSRFSGLSLATIVSKARHPTLYPMSLSFRSKSGIVSTRPCEYLTISEYKSEKHDSFRKSEAAIVVVVKIVREGMTTALPSSTAVAQDDLYGAAPVFRTACAQANHDFLACKMANGGKYGDPVKCLPQGEAVTHCVAQVNTKLQATCLEDLNAYKACLKTNLQLGATRFQLCESLADALKVCGGGGEESP